MEKVVSSTFRHSTGMWETQMVFHPWELNRGHQIARALLCLHPSQPKGPV